MGDSRNENILEATIEGIEYNDPPQSRIEDLLLELKETIEEGGGGGGGDGHTIQNADDVSLTQRNILKFAGTLKATDDSTNKKTVISDAAEEVEWSVWNAMTEAERDAYSAGKKLNIVNVPGAEGTISADLMDLLWENPSPTTEFAAQTISVDLSQYDRIKIVRKRATNSGQTLPDLECKCEGGIIINDTVSFTAASTNRIQQNNRVYTFHNALTGINVANCDVSTVQSNVTTDNTCIIPLQIYGIKKTISLKINAIASDVSTSASKCMMSDGETSVEDAVTELKEDTGWVGVSNYLMYRVKNGIVYLQFGYNTSTNGWLDIGEIPSEYAPPYSNITSCVYSNNTEFANILVYKAAHKVAIYCNVAFNAIYSYSL